jgi:folate-binding protein YgfZ
MPITCLSDRCVIAVSGPEARPFLQGLITNDIERLEVQPAIYAALLTPQGKVLVDFLIANDGAGGYLIDAPAAQAADLFKRLKLYRMRAKVDLTDLAATHGVFAVWGDSSVAEGHGGVRYPDPRLHALGMRHIIEREDLPAGSPDSLAAYATHRLQLGVPDSPDVEGQFPLDANFEELSGVDFRKGCFVGQEVTARMKHKAQPRKRMATVESDPASLQPGTKLVDQDGTEVGEVKTGAGRVAMASLRLDRLAEAKSVMSGSASAAILRPGYDLAVLKPFSPDR